MKFPLRAVDLPREVATLVGDLTLHASVGVDGAGYPVAVRVGVAGKAPALELRMAP